MGLIRPCRFRLHVQLNSYGGTRIGVFCAPRTITTVRARKFGVHLPPSESSARIGRLTTTAVAAQRPFESEQEERQQSAEFRNSLNKRYEASLAFFLLFYTSHVSLPLLAFTFDIVLKLRTYFAKGKRNGRPACKNMSR